MSDKPEFFNRLPSDITIDILSRPPIRSIAMCNCVCKPWRNLLRSRQFADFHLSKSVAAGLIVGGGADEQPRKKYKVFECDDELGRPLTKFDSSEFIAFSSAVLEGSASGLLLWRTTEYDGLYVCNPITRECIQLRYDGFDFRYITATYGFGVSRTSGEHKVVKILRGYEDSSGSFFKMNKYICLVYVLGTREWRIVAPPASLLEDRRCPVALDRGSIGLPLNGNLHWLVQLLDGSNWISCFDVETETFSTFSLPPEMYRVGLVALGDCLCVCNNTDAEIVFWLMEQYGDEKSWTKEFVIRKGPEFVFDCRCLQRCREVVYPIKVFKDGEILMAWHDVYTICYSNETKTTRRTDVFGLDELGDELQHCFELGGMKVLTYTPSFLSLTSFANETVTPF